MADRVVTPNPWLWKPRFRPIRFIEIHSTRGGTSSPAIDYVATGNWMQNQNNGSAQQGWGSSCSRVLGPMGEMTYVLADNQMPTYSAGYGSVGPPTGWSIDEYGKSYEWAQPHTTTPYSDLMYRRGAKEIAKDCVTYGIPPVFITVYNQTGPVPTGLVRHDRCANGVKLGKSDPGNPFNEQYFTSLLQAEIAALEDDLALTDKEKQTLERMSGYLDILATKVKPTYPGVDPVAVQERSWLDQVLWTLMALDSNRFTWLLGEGNFPSTQTARDTFFKEVGRSVRTELERLPPSAITSTQINQIADAVATKFSQRLVS